MSIKVSGMNYVYLGLGDQLIRSFARCPQNRRTEDDVQCIEIALNIDGIPLFKSSNTCLWPVLCYITNICPVDVFPVAITYGTTKPTNLDFFQETNNSPPYMTIKMAAARSVNMGEKETESLFNVWVKTTSSFLVRIRPTKKKKKKMKNVSSSTSKICFVRCGVSFSILSMEKQQCANFLSIEQEDIHTNYNIGKGSPFWYFFCK